MANKNGFFKLELLILSILKNEDCYGYEITSKIKKITNNTIIIKDGTLYPILMKLLERNYVTSYDQIIGKKIRVYYHLEPLGKEKLEEMIHDFTSTVNYIYDVIYYEETENKE